MLLSFIKVLSTQPRTQAPGGQALAWWEKRRERRWRRRRRKVAQERRERRKVEVVWENVKKI